MHMSGRVVLLAGPKRSGTTEIAGLVHAELGFEQFYATTEVLQPALKRAQPTEESIASTVKS